MTYTAPSTKTLDRDHPLMIAQRELENEAIGRGTERYYAALEKSGEQNMPAGMLLIKRTVLPLAEAIKKWVEEARETALDEALELFHTQVFGMSPTSLSWVN